MITRFNVGEEIALTIVGKIKRINVDSSGICYTVRVTDSSERESDLYVDEEMMQFARNTDCTRV